jgi:hypothetical protein
MNATTAGSIAPSVEPLGHRLLARAGLACLAVALAVAAVLIFAELGGDRLRGDEHNAIHFLKDGLVDYVRTFHYGHLIKIQFWLSHELFGNSFFWYRMPAALSAAAFALWLAFYKVDGFPTNRISQGAVLLFVLGNEYLLDFARWGMPVYMQSILASALLLGLVLRDVMQGTTPRWTLPRLLLIALMPWLYPATVILLGAISAWLLLVIVFVRPQGNPFADVGALARRVASALVPVVLGVVSLATFRWSVPDAQWERARGHHISFKDWVAEDRGGAFAYLADSLRNLGHDAMRLVELGNSPTYKLLSTVYAALGVLIALSIVAALAIALVRRARRSPSLPVDVGLVRGSVFLLTCIASSLVVTNGASLLDLYPAAGLRHEFFLIPAVALLAVISMAYLGYVGGLLARHRLDGPADALRAAGVLAMVAFGGLLAKADYEHMHADAEQYRKLLAIVHSPDNDIVVSWQTEFYVSPETMPNHPLYIQVDRGAGFPPVVAHEIEIMGRKAPGSRFAVLTRAWALNADEGAALWKFAKDHGLRVIDQYSYKTFAALAFEIQPRDSAPKLETVEATIPLPAEGIVSVRLDPTPWLNSTITIDELSLTDQAGLHPIDVCADKKLQLVRSVRLGGSAATGCNLVLGDSANTGWIGPSSLRNLPAQAAPRTLHIRMTGEFADQFRVYVDVGQGYKKPIVVDADAATAE